MEPDTVNPLLYNLFVGGVPFLSYFFGILVRKVVFPGQQSPSLLHQLLLGIPVSLIVVSPLLPVLAATKTNLGGFLVTLGIIMEHGMIVNETATKQFHDRRRELDAGKSLER